MATIAGLIRRRILVNFRADPEVIQRVLPAPFRPKLHAGHAIVGICLIRLEQIRPKWFPAFCGIASENAAHRIAVRWEDAGGVAKEGVFIPRRDTGSWLNHFAGGRLFPGEHGLADFNVQDDGKRVSLAIKARDGRMNIVLRGRETNVFPTTSCFASLEESSAYFASGGIGYSTRRDCCGLDGIRLEPEGWSVRPLEIEQVTSSYFQSADFPAGSVTFDHALIMRDLQHEWHTEPDLSAEFAPKSAVSA